MISFQNGKSTLIVYKFKQMYSITESKLQYMSEITHVEQNKFYVLSSNPYVYVQHAVAI